MKRLSIWMRIAIGNSISWLVGLLLLGLVFDEILLSFFAIIPLLAVWVIWWKGRGRKSNKTDKAEDIRVEVDSITEELRDIQAKLHKVESKLSELEKTK